MPDEQPRRPFKPLPESCSGSGRPPTEVIADTGRCPTCGYLYMLTSNVLVRRHRKREAVR